jgi:hypothetical protein
LAPPASAIPPSVHRSQFIFVRVRAAHDIPGQTTAPREEWLIAEWAEGRDRPLG